VRQISQRASVRLAALFEFLRGDQQGGDRGRRQQPPGVTNAICRLRSRDQRHDRDTGLEAGQSECKFREEHQRDPDHGQHVAVTRKERAAPAPDGLGMPEHFTHADRGYDYIQRQVDPYENDGDANRLPEPLQENCAEDGEERQRDRHLISQDVRGEGVLNEVSSGVGCR